MAFSRKSLLETMCGNVKALLVWCSLEEMAFSNALGLLSQRGLRCNEDEKETLHREKLCTWKQVALRHLHVETLKHTNIPISVAFKDEKSLDERKYALEKS